MSDVKKVLNFELNHASLIVYSLYVQHGSKLAVKLLAVDWMPKALVFHHELEKRKEDEKEKRKEEHQRTMESDLW